MTFQEASADLRWYFRDSAGAMGLRSNFGGMVAQLEGGGFHQRAGYEADQRALEAAERAREIRKALDASPVWAQVVLRIAYRLMDGERRLIGITTSAALAHARSRSKRELGEWLEKCRTSKDMGRKKEWAALRAESQGLLEDALSAYGLAVDSNRERRKVDRPEA